MKAFVWIQNNYFDVKLCTKVMHVETKKRDTKVENKKNYFKLSLNPKIILKLS